MSEFIPLTRVTEVPDPGKAYFELDDRMVVLFHVGGEFFCLDDVCTHDGGPLGEGVFEDHTIACPRHGAKFDIRTGDALTMPATQGTQRYEVRVDQGMVYVRGEHTASDSGPVTATASTSTPAVATPSPPSSSDKPHDLATSSATPAAPASSPESLPAAGPLSEAAVFEELKHVIDPELFVNIVDLGLVYVVDLQPGEAPGQSKVMIEMTMTSPACPAGPQLIQNSKMTVGRMPGVEAVEVKIVMDPPWTPDKMTEEARDRLGIF